MRANSFREAIFIRNWAQEGEINHLLPSLQCPWLSQLVVYVCLLLQLNFSLNLEESQLQISSITSNLAYNLLSA